MTITCDLRKSEDKRRALDEYLTANVLAANFICTHYSECRSSYPETFYEGQLHHIGRFFDLLVENLPFRIVVVDKSTDTGLLESTPKADTI
jgi:hypothetical protein